VSLVKTGKFCLSSNLPHTAFIPLEPAEPLGTGPNGIKNGIELRDELFWSREACLLAVPQEMAVNDDELIKEFIRVERRDDAVDIRVRQITWPTPSWPVGNWTVVRELPSEASTEQIDKAVRFVLADARFFGVCGQCRERNPNGWMRDAEVC
jgi:hypothetical protein